MKKEELIEGYLVYTDSGIEKVHWCNVNGVKELVSPKGKVYGYVPDYFENKRLQEQLKEANDLLKGLYDDSPCQFDHCGYCQEHGSTDGNYICVQGELKEYLERWGVK